MGRWMGGVHSTRPFLFGSILHFYSNCQISSTCTKVDTFRNWNWYYNNSFGASFFLGAMASSHFHPYSSGFVVSRIGKYSLTMIFVLSFLWKGQRIKKCYWKVDQKPFYSYDTNPGLNYARIPDCNHKNELTTITIVQQTFFHLLANTNKHSSIKTN